MTEPRRIQRKRTKGWRMPEGAIYVGRPTKWGNPYKITGYRFQTSEGKPCPRDKSAAVEMALRDYEMALEVGILNFTPSDVVSVLRGKNLVCWCPLDQPCHADVLLDLANA